MNVDQLILRILEQREVEDQAELQKLLKKQGQALTQSTLSRHLKKLSVQKKNGRYQRVEVGNKELPQASILEAPPNLLVIKTAPGFAAATAYALDERVSPELLAGTIAGEDTVFVALRDPARQSEALKAVKRILGLL
jgi:transcriptional regulator of arginine metabolism